MRRRGWNATESLSIADAEELLATSRAWTADVLERVSPRLPEGDEPLRILEIGSAQGRTLLSLAEVGHEACGIEPHVPAIEVAHELAARHGAAIDVREGRAEAIPYDDAEFDVVLAFAVMEHVVDLHESLNEIHRVLKPGGVFWFSSASAMCWRQNEIGRFPMFGWYPDRLKRRIMRWAVENKPEIIGHTGTPAVWWWTPRRAHRWLEAAGFVDIVDRWQMRPGIPPIVKRSSVLRAAGDVVMPGCSYAATKPKLA
ncbi:MAG: class I SAM-dependent methyltransferase [Acidimicrobiales bacterium]